MALSTVEVLSRQKQQETALESSGQRQKFEDAVRKGIAQVVAQATGERRFRNLWGLSPVKQQELLFYKAADGRDLDYVRVAGKRFTWGLPAAEDLVWDIFYDVAKGRSWSSGIEENKITGRYGHINAAILTSKIPSLGIEFKQTRFTAADPWNPLAAIHWDVALASDKKK